MSHRPIKPSTLDGIKRYTKTLKKSLTLTHARALDEAAMAGGYKNFRHAQNVLGKGRPAPAEHLAYISVTWRDADTNAAGEEILSLHLDTPLNALVKPNHLKAARHLLDFKMKTADHLAYDFVESSRKKARRRACAVARTLAFMQATGLRPSSGRSRAYPQGDLRNALPGRDHGSVWFDPTTKVYIYVDEPYADSIKSRVNERQAWSKTHGWAVARPNWAGMYNPDGGCELYLASDKTKGFDLETAVAALNALPPPFIEADWDGKSEPMFPPFESPAAGS